MGGFHFMAWGLLGDSLNVARVSLGTVSLKKKKSPHPPATPAWGLNGKRGTFSLRETVCI